MRIATILTLVAFFPTLVVNGSEHDVIDDIDNRVLQGQGGGQGGGGQGGGGQGGGGQGGGGPPGSGIDTLAPVNGQCVGTGPSPGGGILVDGMKTDWTTDSADFIADMMRSNNPNHSNPLVIGKSYGRYDGSILCLRIDRVGTGTAFDGVTGSGQPDPAVHWVKMNNNPAPTPPNNILFETGPNPTFWEACYPAPTGTTTHIRVHSQIITGGVSQTATTFKVDLLPSPSICGDPHLQSWGGVKWDYHGECDLVAIRNAEFADGKGLELHVRTTRDHHYSFTNEAALKIGDDIFEVHSLSEYKLNGEIGDYTNKTTDSLGGFPLSHWHSGSRDNLFFHRHVLSLGETGEKIEIKTFENIVYVEVEGTRSGVFKGSTGLFGDADSGKLIGRDGETEFEPSDEYALDWQVRDTDPKLFSTARAPIYPEKCLSPKKFIPRLGFMQVQKQAEELCAAWDGDKESCVFDVLASGNKDLAQYKVMDAEAKTAALLEQQEITTTDA